MEKPKALEVIAKNIPEFLTVKKRWVLWAYEFRHEKWTKVPKFLTVKGELKNASSTSDKTWNDYGRIIDYYEGNKDVVDGVGHVLNGYGGLVGIDVDHCIVDGFVPNDMLATLQYLDTYTEISPSGHGVRAFALAQGFTPTWNKNERYEIYKDGRFLTVTGHTLNISETVNERLEHVQNFATAYGPTSKPTPAKLEEHEDHVQAERPDEWILDRCTTAPNADKFRRLWTGDLSEHQDDHSRGDQALINLLSFWTRDAIQVDRLFRRSQLYRDKWDRPDYRERTIGNAFENEEFYQGHDDPLVLEAAMKDWKNKNSKLTERTHVEIEDVTEPDEPDDFNEAAPVPKERNRWMRLNKLDMMPEPEYLVGRHICRDSLTCISGPPGCKKSFFALDMALCVASGKDFLGRFRVKQGTAAYIYSEGIRGAHRRVKAWAMHHDVIIPHDAIVTPDMFNLFKDAPMILAEIEQELGSTPDMIVVDTLARNFDGDENKTEDMSKFVKGLDALRAHGSAVVVVHHTGKDSAKGERGSTALRGAVNTSFQLDPVDDQVRVKCSKMKDGEPPATYFVGHESYGWGTDSFGESIGSIALFYSEGGVDLVVDQPSDAKVVDIGDGITLGEAIERWGQTRSTARRQLEKCVTDGLLHRDKSGKEVVYRPINHASKLCPDVFAVDARVDT